MSNGFKSGQSLTVTRQCFSLLHLKIYIKLVSCDNIHNSTSAFPKNWHSKHLSC